MSSLSVDQVPTLSYRLSGSLTSFDASPDKSNAVVAGREVLRVLRVGETEINDVLNLRWSPGGVMSVYNTGHTSEFIDGKSIAEGAGPTHAVKMSNLNMNMNDVKWEPIYQSATIATAAANGAIVVWQLQRSSSKSSQRYERVITEHLRAVNRICFNKKQPWQLMSGSQDGTIKIWDLRVKGIARITLECKNDGVRDVQFNPTNAYDIAACFENGSVQKWDIRKPKLCERRWNAHNGPSLKLDWHENGKLLATGGRDKAIKIWNLTGQVRKPLCTMATMAAISVVAWRPGSETQLASCSLSNDMAIHVRDLQRKFVPLYTWQDHENFPTGLLWIDSDTIWSCGKDRNFIRTNLRGAYRYADALSTCALAWSPRGDLAYAAEKWNPESVMDSMSSLRVPSSNASAAKSSLSDSSGDAMHPSPEGTHKIFSPEVTLQRYFVRQKAGVLVANCISPMQGGLRAYADHVSFDCSLDKLHDTCVQNAFAAKSANLSQTCALWMFLSEYVIQTPSVLRTLTSSSKFWKKEPSTASLHADDKPPESSDNDSEDEYEQSRVDPEYDKTSMLSSLVNLGYSEPYQWQEPSSRSSSLLSEVDGERNKQHTHHESNNASITSGSVHHLANKNTEATTSAMREALFLTSLLFHSTSGPVKPSLLTEHPLMSLYLQPENHFSQLKSLSFAKKGLKVSEPVVMKHYPNEVFRKNRSSTNLSDRPFNQAQEPASPSMASQSVTEGLIQRRARRRNLALIKDIFDRLLEEEGSPILAVTVLLVFSEFCGGWDVVARLFGSHRIEQLHFYSVELLRTFQCWSAAAYLIKCCPLSSVRLLTQEGTCVSLLCIKCKAIVPSIGENSSSTPNSTSLGGAALCICRKCGTLATRCFYCNLPIRGLLVWCSVCGTNFHSSCYKELTEYFDSYPEQCHGCDCFCTFDFLRAT